jgi:hypothetical protein
MTHSLAALPTMSAVPADMLHYSNSGTHSRAKVSPLDVPLRSAPLMGSIDGTRYAKAETTRRQAALCSAQCTPHPPLIITTPNPSSLGT